MINFVAPEIYKLFSDSNNYGEAIAKLKAVYVKTPNEIFARHTLSTRKQRSIESFDEYLRVLTVLSKDCNFKPVTASEHRDQFIRDAFISGLLNNHIRQRLLENKELDLQTAFDQAHSIDTALKSAEHYQTHTLASINPHKLQEKSVSLRENKKIETKDVSARLAKSCSYCGGFFHPRYSCCLTKCANLATPGWHRELCKSCSFFKFIVTQFSRGKASAGMFSSPHL